MSALRAFVLFMLAAVPAGAQGLTSEGGHQGVVNFGLYAGGGTGLMQASLRYRTTDIRFLLLGGRVGWVVTPQLFHGWRGSSIEYAVEVTPVTYVFQPVGAV
jgi:hypothetical protein